MCEVMEELMKDLNRENEKEKESRLIRAFAIKKLTLEDIAEMFEMPLAKVTEFGRLHHLI